LSDVICCWMRLFSAFWKLKCRFLCKLHFTFPTQYARARWTNFSWRRLSSWSARIPRCPSRFAKSALPSYGCSARWKCFWFVAASEGKYFEGLQLALQGSRVGTEAVASVVHLQ
jgi:hypothetical protein